MQRLMIWLHPDTASRERIEAAAVYLREVVGDRLPAVTPHLTVASGRSDVDVMQALHEAIAGVGPLVLSSIGVSRYPDPSEPGFHVLQSLYVPFHDTDALRALRRACGATFGWGDMARTTEPYVSLAYTGRSKRAKGSWLHTLETLGGSVVHGQAPLQFDVIDVRRDVPDEDLATRIRSWEILASARLSVPTRP